MERTWGACGLSTYLLSRHLKVKTRFGKVWQRRRKQKPLLSLTLVGTKSHERSAVD